MSQGSMGIAIRDSTRGTTRVPVYRFVYRVL